MSDIIGIVVVLGLLFGPEILALLILVIAARYGRQLSLIIVCGVIAAVVMAVESVVWLIWSTGGDSFGLGGDANQMIVAAVSILSLGIYFPVAIKRCRRGATSAVPAAP